MKKYTLPNLHLVLISCLLTFLLLSCTQATDISAPSIPITTPNIPITAESQVPKTYPEALPDLLLYPISSLIFDSDRVMNTEGYVVHQQKTPECPKGAQPKPCQQSYIIIYENNLPVHDAARLSNQQIVIQVDNPLQFLRLTHYRFTITHALKNNKKEWGLLGYSESEAARKADNIPNKDEEIIRSLYAIDPNELVCNGMLVTSLIEQYKDHMFACLVDTDCVPTRLSCGGATSVNKKFKPLYEYLDDARTACYECAPIFGDVTNLRCENNQCMADFIAKDSP